MIDDPEAHVVSIFREVLRTDAISPETSIFELGATSLDTMRIVALLEVAIDAPDVLETLLRTGTARAVARAIGDDGSSG